MTFSNKAKHLGLVLAPLVFGLPSSPVSADERGAIDVVHYWVSKSEARALDVFRDAWSRAGNRWIDLPMENKVAVQRTVSDRVASGYAPAVMQWNANEGSRELPEMGIVLDLEEVAAADRWREVLPATVVDRISFKGKIYFAPTNIHAENWLWTSKALFDRLGLPAPRTWEEIIGAADRIKQEGHVALALGGGRWEISLIFNNIMYQQLGSQGYARVIRGDASMIRDPRMAEALSMLRRLSSYAEPAQRRVGKTWADAAAAGGSGGAGMQVMGDWAKGELMTRGYVLDKDFQCSLVPGTEIAYFMVVDAFAFPITNREASIKAQRDFARVVMDPVNQVAFSGLKGSLPVRTDVDPSNLDRCGRLGLEMIARNSDVSAQSMAMPAQMSEAFIAVLANFFDDDRIPVESAQEQLYAVLSKK
ncbi:ABC transporter substrate-binding protein [Agrobacterium salinitolerans]|uniref:Probable sugar-binding periplasmic protein n=1 Tax=Agrobacterium salinitolerans TaxID=1183413 RepID=A0A9X3R057_9HYPH|nr:ABC transporter substrate-binding protein [Agrobacterium salinitolerans]MCZ7939141.1 ABC transporter substrate-binding protein [Agrobacterium salinitolerans]